VRGGRRIATIGLTGLAVLGTGVVDVATHHGTTPAEHTVAWDRRVLPIVEFVEAHRGLRFKHPVPVSFLDEAGFEAQVAVPAAETKQDEADLERFVGTLRALGLVRGKVDLRSELDTLNRSSVIGLYLPSKQAVFVRGSTLDAFTRVTLAHELTHVLQDQYFDLDKMQDDAPGDDTTAVTSLIEGDAVRIESLYQEELSAADQAAYDRAARVASERSDGASSVPAVLSDLLSFPYLFGPVLLEHLTQRDGNAAVDRAFRRPPYQEAQIVDPLAHPTDEKAATVAPPRLPAGSARLGDVAPFGQVSLFELLGSRLDYRTSWSAVADWRGDAAYPYRLGGRTCIAIDVKMAGASGTVLLEQAFRTWAHGVPGATAASADGLVMIRSCDPGARARPLPSTDPSPFDVLAARATIIREVMGSGGRYAFGRCIADGVISTLGPARYGDLTSSDLPAPRLRALQSLASRQAAHCSGDAG
jgi:hypothetical protein